METDHYLDSLKHKLGCVVRDHYRNEFFSRFSRFKPALEMVFRIFYDQYVLPAGWQIYWAGSSASYAIGQISCFSTISIFIVGPKNVPFDLVYECIRHLSRTLQWYYGFTQKISYLSQQRIANVILYCEIERGVPSEKPLKLQLVITTHLATFDFIECMVLIPIKERHVPGKPVIYIDLCECHRLNHVNNLWRTIPYFKWGRLISCKPNLVSSTKDIFKEDSSINTFIRWRRRRQVCLQRFFHFNQWIMEQQKGYRTNFLSPYCIRCKVRESRLLHIISWWYYRTYRYKSRLVSKLENEFYGNDYINLINKPETEGEAKLSDIISYWHFITYLKFIHRK